jgi:hypothetical protein
MIHRETIAALAASPAAFAAAGAPTKLQLGCTTSPYLALPQGKSATSGAAVRRVS